MKRILLFALGYILFACNTTTTSNVASENYKIIVFSTEDVPLKTTLVGKKYTFEEIVAPENILVVNNLLVIADGDQNKLVHLVDVKNNRYIRKYGKYGEGPGEMGSVSHLLPGLTQGSFWTYSAGTKQLSEFNIADTTRLSHRQIKQQNEFFLAARVAWSSDSTLMTTRTDGEEKFVEYNTKGKIINSYGTWRGMIGNDDTPASIICSLHQGSLNSSPDNSVFLMTCIQRDLIEIFDRKTQKTISIRGPENKTPNFSIDYKPGYPMPVVDRNHQLYYTNGFFGKDYIYTMYCGKFTSELMKTGDYNRTIFVFDLSGNVKAMFDLDHSLYNFTVDEENKKIYGVTYDADPNIVEFDLPMIK